MENQIQEELSIQDYARIVIDIISDFKGEDIILLDLRDVTVITDFFVICTADNERQLKAIVENITLTMKKEYDLPRPLAEGDASSGWILIDYNDFVVHVFSEDQRRYYDLEELWSEGNVLLRMQ